MQSTADAATAASSLQSVQGLLKAGHDFAGQAAVYYAKSEEYAGKYWVWIKQHDGTLNFVGLCAVGAPLLYNNWGSAAVGLGCAVFAPQVFPDLYQKITGIWKETDFGKLALCTAGFICMEWNPWPFAAFSYGAHLGSRIKAIGTPAQAAASGEEQKPSVGMGSWLWNSVFGPKKHAE